METGRYSTGDQFNPGKQCRGHRMNFYKHGRIRPTKSPFFEYSRLATRGGHTVLSLRSHSMNVKLSSAEQCALIIKTGSSQFPLQLDKYLFAGPAIC